MTQMSDMTDVLLDVHLVLILQMMQIKQQGKALYQNVTI